MISEESKMLKGLVVTSMLVAGRNVQRGATHHGSLVR